MSKIYTLLVLLVASGPSASAEASELVARIPRSFAEQFAKAHAPDAEGALGRNRSGYFHVRFQMGLHHLADLAVINQDQAVAERFVKALEYSFQRQKPEGDFDLQVPSALAGQGSPNASDMASADAFFLSSCGSGLLTLRDSEWFQTDTDLAPLRDRIGRLNPHLRKALESLKSKRALLERGDARAPNRLLFDALAYRTLGKLLEDDDALNLAKSFQTAALRSQHLEGYFIEGTGFDSSYNGVACAVGYRLLLCDPANEPLQNALKHAIVWQKSKVLDSGEISTEGNHRVRPGGESFLGTEKQVDVMHSVEAFILASIFDETETYLQTASKIISFYYANR